MTKSWARVGAIVVSGFGLVGCTGGVTAVGVPDAGPDVPIVKYDVPPDVDPVVVKLDAPAGVDTPPVSCTVIDGGQICVSMSCGNGILEGSEDCDDGNTTPGDGCASGCKLESGWFCLA